MHPATAQALQSVGGNTSSSSSTYHDHNTVTARVLICRVDHRFQHMTDVITIYKTL